MNPFFGMFDMPRNDAARIQDIRESCDRISQFVAKINSANNEIGNKKIDKKHRAIAGAPI